MPFYTLISVRLRYLILVYIDVNKKTEKFYHSLNLIVNSCLRCKYHLHYHNLSKNSKWPIHNRQNELVYYHTTIVNHVLQKLIISLLPLFKKIFVESFFISFEAGSTLLRSLILLLTYNVTLKSNWIESEV